MGGWLILAGLGLWALSKKAEPVATPAATVGDAVADNFYEADPMADPQTGNVPEIAVDSFLPEPGVEQPADGNAPVTVQPGYEPAIQTTVPMVEVNYDPWGIHMVPDLTEQFADKIALFNYYVSQINEAMTKAYAGVGRTVEANQLFVPITRIVQGYARPNDGLLRIEYVGFPPQMLKKASDFDALLSTYKHRLYYYQHWAPVPDF
jgi:hypothetical protein